MHSIYIVDIIVSSLTDVKDLYLELLSRFCGNIKTTLKIHWKAVSEQSPEELVSMLNRWKTH